MHHPMFIPSREKSVFWRPIWPTEDPSQYIPGKPSIFEVNVYVSWSKKFGVAQAPP